MAKVITDEKIKLTIVVNGNEAQKELGELENSLRDLNVQQKELRKEKQLLGKQGLKDTERYKAVTASIKENSLAITANKTRMSELQKEVGLMGLTMGQLQSKAIALKTVLRGMIPGTENYKNTKNELAQITDRINDLNGKSTKAKFSISSLADSFNRYQAIGVTVIAALTGVALSISKIIDINGKLSDAQADVMKTTGMTKKEVDELTKSFGLLQTRTQRIDLLKIAEQGGRIGIVKDEIGQFVDVMNKAAVALGDSFTGGVEEVANKLGKLKFLFEETKNMSVDQAYNAIGSAINDLGANGVASEANIADFATRIGSLTDVLKPSIRETLALGAAFEESGIESEVSGRAYNIFMKQASTESAKFAQVMGLTQKQVEGLINTNPLDFMMKFAEGLRGMNATETAKTLDFLGVNADGANKVIGAMGNNIGRFRELIDLSNNSFVAGTSLINEYNIKNNNLAATLEKIKKTITGWFSSETFTKWLADAANNFAKLIGAVDDADGTMAKWKNTLAFTAKMIAVIIASMLSYSAATRVATLVSNGMTASTSLFNIALKLQTLYLSIQKAGLIIYTGVMSFFGIATDKASASLARLNLVSKLSPWGALLAVIAAVTVAYIAFGNETKKAATSQETFAKQMKQLSIDASKATSDTKANITSLVNLVKDEAVSMSTRKKAYEELIKISPVFNGYLVDEKFNIAGLLTIYAEYLKALDKVAYARQFNKLNEGNIKKQIDAEQQLFNAEKKLQEEKAKALKAYKASEGATNINRSELLNSQGVIDAKKALDDAKANLKNANELVAGTNTFREAQIKALTESITAGENTLKSIADKSSEEFKKVTIKLQSDKAALEAIIGKGKATPSTSDYNVPTGDGKEGKKDTTKTLEEMNKERLESEAKFQAELLKLKRQSEDDEIALMQDGYDKEMAIEALRYKREIEDLQSQKVRADEMAKLDSQIAKAKQDKDTKYYDFLVNQKKVWGQRNQKLDDEINKITEGKFAAHQLKLGIIQEKGAKTAIEKEKEAFDRAKVLRQIKFNEQLAALGDNQKAKDRLTEDFNKNELLIEQKFLEDLIKKFNDIVGKGNFGKIDLDLLTPEQVDTFTKLAEEAGLTLSELIAKRNELLGKDVKNAEALGVSGSTDILGFSSENWDTFFSNLDKGKVGISEMVFAVGALTNAYSMYSEFLSANENAQLKNYQRNADTKKKKLKQQLDSGMINQHQYKKGIEKIDDDLEKKKLDIEYKQAKRQKIIAAMNIVNSTAQAIIGIWAQFPKFDFGATAAIMSGVVGALGALQLATVLAQPLPSRGAEKGLYPEYVKREQDGRVFKTTGTSGMKTGLYSKPRLLVGEGPGDTPEMVIDKRSYAQLSPATKNALIRELSGVRGFEDGYYNPKSMRYEVPTSSPSAPTSNNNDALLQMALVALDRNSAVMEDIVKYGITATVKRNDTRSMDEIRKGIEDAQKLRNNAKK